MQKAITTILVLTSLLVFLTVSGCGANAFKVSKSTDSYNVDLTADHNPLTTGENQLQITISDKNGAATTPAKPASAVPKPTTPALKRSVLTPCMAVVVGSVLAARTNKPTLE